MPPLDTHTAFELVAAVGAVFAFAVLLIVALASEDGDM